MSCPAPAIVGDQETIGGITYFVVDRPALISVVETGSFTDGVSTFTPADLSCVCTTQITYMESIFYNRTGGDTFDTDISNWDVSNVTTMRNMFRDATTFNQNIDNWLSLIHI